MSLPRGVRYVSIGPGDGYGYSAQGYLGVLGRLGVPVRWEPIDLADDRPTRGGDRAEPLRPLDRARRRPRHGDRQPARRSGAGPRGRRVAAAEGGHHHRRDRPDPGLVGAVPGLRWTGWWCRARSTGDVFTASGVTTPIWVVPHVSTLPSGTEPFEHPALAARFVFYAIGPWTTRKGLAETVLAFADAFTASDPVALVVKTGLVDHQAKLRAFHADEAEAAGRSRRAVRGRPARRPDGDLVDAGPAVGRPAVGARGAAGDRHLGRGHPGQPPPPRATAWCR